MVCEDSFKPDSFVAFHVLLNRQRKEAKAPANVPIELNPVKLSVSFTEKGECVSTFFLSEIIQPSSKSIANRSKDKQQNVEISLERT